MKKNYLKLIVAIVLASNVFAQNIPSYLPKEGLVGWWPFNGNANDESGNGNHGIVNGATLTTDRNGNSNSAYSFNGINNVITVKRNYLENFSFSGWYNLTKLQDYSPIIDANDAVWEILIRYYNPDFIKWIKSPGTYTEFLCDNTSNKTDKWYHIVLVFNSNKASIYIDGVIVKSFSNIILPISNGNYNFGGSISGAPQYLNGKLDDFGIWNRALTDIEINSLYTGTPLCTSPTSIIIPQGKTTFCQGGFVNLQAYEGANYSYEWFNNSQLIAGATQSVYQASISGNYIVKVTDGACNASSSAVLVTVNPNPIAKITPDGPTAFCEGGAVNLVASGGTTYKWNSGILTPSITVTKTGTYYVNVINSFGCSVNKSYDVNVYPNPTVSITPIPQFTLQNNSSIKLSATPAGGAFKGEGVTGTSFNPSNIGLGKKTIYYNYTSTQGCSGSAKLQTIVVDSIGTKCTSYDTITVTNTINDTVGILKIKFQLTTGIKANQFTSVSVYPNPTSDVLIIDASDVQALNGYRYKMIDISGKTVYNELVSAAKTEINLKALGAKGVYVLHIIDGKGTSIDSKKIVLE